jgi:hypothetical protein
LSFSIIIKYEGDASFSGNIRQILRKKAAFKVICQLEEENKGTVMTLTQEWTKLYNEELNDLYSLPNIVRVIKSKRMRWERHVVWGKGEVCTGFWWGNLRERDRLGDPVVDGRIILGWIFKKWDMGVRTGLGWLRIRTGGGGL